LNTWDIATVYLGHRLGLYQALSDLEPATPTDTGSVCCTAFPSAWRINRRRRPEQLCAPARCAAMPRSAGFGAVEVLPLEHPFFRFYRLFD
jgi:hypothetical protein